MNSLINPFSIETMSIRTDMIVDRAQEVEALYHRIIERRENALVTGTFGIGKTCVLRKFREQAQSRCGRRLLPVEMEMFSISEDPSLFLSDVLLALFQKTWTEVLNQPFSRLLTAVQSPRDVREGLVSSIASILSLYRLVRPEEVVAQLGRETTLGVDKIVKGIVEERSSRTIARGGLKPSEFIHLADELLAILMDHHIEQIVIFGDEANHIAPNLEAEIFRKNFEAFSKRNVQFVFTTGEDVMERVPRLQDAFPSALQLSAFQSPRVMQDFYSIYLKDLQARLSFSDRATDCIWRISEGFPREIQRICQSCVDIAAMRGVDLVDIDILMDACLDSYRMIPR